MLYREGNSGVGASDAAPQEELASSLPIRIQKDLAAELQRADELGIRPIHVDDPEFEQMAQEGPIIWVVLESGQLLTAPSSVAHTVLSAGEAVIAAGNAVVAINGNERFCIDITTNSDHYQSDDQSLEIGKLAFSAFGVRFEEEERLRDGGAAQEEPQIFANTHPEDLAAELETAAILGISSNACG